MWLKNKDKEKERQAPSISPHGGGNLEDIGEDTLIPRRRIWR